MKGEACPEVGGLPSCSVANGKLGGPERGGRWHTFYEKIAIETRHERRRGAIVNVPIANHDAADSGAEEGLGEAHHSLPSHLPAQGRLARAQHRELGGKVQAGHVGRGEETFAALTVVIDQRENDARSFRQDRIQETVGGEVKDAIASQGTAQNEIPIRRGSQSQERLLRGNEARDGLSLFGRVGQSMK